MIKAVFLDFDGTVFSHTTESIPKSCVEAINKLTDQGILVYLASGRSIVEMKWFDYSAIKPSGLILCNGQLVYNEKNELVFDYPLTGRLLDFCIRIFNEKKIPSLLVSEDDIYSNFINDYITEVQRRVSSGVPHTKQYQGESIYMSSMFLESEEDERVVDEVRDIAEITVWQEGAIDLVPKGCSKVTGIEYVMKKYNIDVSETMAIGDGENDISMIKYCGIGVAMGHGKEVVKKAADYVTDSIEEDGIANAFKHFGLI